MRQKQRPSRRPSAQQSPVLLPHTELQAPYRLSVTDVRTASADDDILAGDLAHPELGVVGHLYTTYGGGPKFAPADTSVFGIADLQAFAEQCTERGRSLRDAASPIETVLNLVLIEHDFNGHVRAMIRAGRQSLIRLVDDADPALRTYEQVVTWSRVLFEHRDRTQAAAALRQHIPDLPSTQRWQLWTGQTWIPLTEDHPEAAPADAATLTALREAKASWAANGGQGFMRCHGPIDNGMYVTELNRAPDGYQTATVAKFFETWRWCICPLGPRSQRVRIEHWTGKDGLAGSGVAHAACRRLISIV